jgi:hypothetical protein
MLSPREVRAEILASGGCCPMCGQSPRDASADLAALEAERDALRDERDEQDDLRTIDTQELVVLREIVGAAFNCRNAQRVAEAIELDLHFNRKKPLRAVDIEQKNASRGHAMRMADVLDAALARARAAGEGR